MAKNRLVAYATRLPMILLLVAGMLGCVAAVGAAGWWLWQVMQPQGDGPLSTINVPGMPDRFLAVLAYFAALLVVLIIMVLPFRLLFVTLEAVVERYWEDDWDRWQARKAALVSRRSA